MASPTPKGRKQEGRKQDVLRQDARARPSANQGAPEVVDPIWLMKAAGLTVLAAFVCGYLTLCLLFYQGQWQLVLHPSRTTSAPASIADVSVEIVKFGVDESALPQLTGWWIPAAASGRYAHTTFLYLPSGDGSLADAAATLTVLHNLGANVFAFDYRGYGQSAAAKPGQTHMAEDAASAWQYLTVSRRLSGGDIVPFGAGVGGALAAELAKSHREVAALVLEAPRPDLLDIVHADPRTKYLPVGLLFHDRFELNPTLATLATPKLLLLSGENSFGPKLKQTTGGAASPKTVVYFQTLDPGDPHFGEALTRFLDAYVRL